MGVPVVLIFFAFISTAFNLPIPLALIPFLHILVLCGIGLLIFVSAIFSKKGR